MHSGPKRSLFQFSLRTLLVVTTLASLPLGWFAYKQNLLRQQRAAINRFHGLIRDAELATQPKAVGRSWAEIRARYEAAGYTSLWSHDAQHTTDHRFLIRRKAWLAANGVPHDLIVDTTVVQRDPTDDESARPDQVISVAAGLVGSPNLPYADAVKEDLYPQGSAVSLCLSQPEVVEAAAKYPILKEIEITYDLIRDRWMREVPFGFHVRIELGEAIEGDDAGQRLHFTVHANLDPIQDWSGQVVEQGFSPSLEIGGAQYWGGNESRRR